MTAATKRVLLACNGGADTVSRGVDVGLAKHGCRLVLVADEGALAATEEEARCCVPGGMATVAMVGLDLAACDEAVVDAAVAAAWHYFGDGGLDALVNYSSYEGEVQDCLRVTEDEYNKTMKVNVIRHWLLITAMAKRFRDIIGAGRGLYPRAAAYETSLGAVHQLVRLSAMELGKHKIRVNTVFRGLHLTDKFPVFVGEEKAEKTIFFVSEGSLGFSATPAVWPNRTLFSPSVSSKTPSSPPPYYSPTCSPRRSRIAATLLRSSTARASPVLPHPDPSLTHSVFSRGWW
ncbi:hypothetical protein ZWY2020_002678 [Hordeum vulgare]|nr:hypothetical protein ZWY2020_002678 [Hordeum vulgare]